MQVISFGGKTPSVKQMAEKAKQAMAAKPQAGLQQPLKADTFQKAQPPIKK
jgi:hypothetical protein